MKDGWELLDITNIPSDLFIEDAWEVRERHVGSGEWWPLCKETAIMIRLTGQQQEYEYSIRRPQPKQPTHEEILDGRYWLTDTGAWVKPVYYHDGFYGVPNNIFDTPIKNLPASWFVNRQSADIPQEKS